MVAPEKIASRYEIRETIGEGSGGTVYKAFDALTGRDVALKIIRNAPPEELRALADLHHRHVVEVLDYGQCEQGAAFLVMPLLRGTTMQRLLGSTRPRLPLERLADIVGQACQGLQAMHDAGLVHKALNPANIFLTESGVKLGDTFAMGAPAYLAPEQADRQECTPASNVFSLAAMCYEALTGVRPARGAPQPLHALNPAVSQLVSGVVHKALALEPWQRFASASLFAEAFQTASRNYESVREAWQNGEFLTALSKLDELRRSDPNASGYAALQQVVEACQKAIEECQAEVAACLEKAQYDSAAQRCDECLDKCPGHPVPRGLKLEIEERRMRDSFAALAEVGLQAGAERDPEHRLEVLDQAARLFPAAPDFEQWRRVLAQRLALARELRTRAQIHEERGQKLEALECWHMLRVACGDHPGVDEEIGRLTGLVAAPASTAAPPSLRAQAWALYHDWIKRGRPFSLTVATIAAVLLILSAALAVRSVRSKPLAPPPDTAAQRVSVFLRAAVAGTLMRVGEVQGIAAPELRVELLPGNYRLEASLDGYKPFTDTLSIPPGAPFTRSLPPLEPLAAAVVVSSDLDHAEVSLDGRPPAQLKNGQFAAEDLAPGKHAIRIFDGRTETRFEFETPSGSVPVVPGAVFTNEQVAIAVGTLGSRMQVNSSLAPAKAVLDGRISADLPPGGLALNDLAKGTHELILGADKERRRVHVASGSRPLLQVFLFSDRNVGTLLVATGLDDFQVFLDDRRYARPIRAGAMRIANLPVKPYRVRVEAEEHYSEPEQTVKIAKGQEQSLKFQLRPVPRFAVLEVRDAPPRTQVLVDNRPLGTAGSDGVFRHDGISPGEHTIELQNPPRYQSRRVVRTFIRGETVHLSGTAAKLQNSPSIVNISVQPAASQLTWKCGGEAQSRQANGPVSIPCAEPHFSVVASRPGYDDAERSLALAPGEKYEVALTLTAKRPPPAPKKTCGSADLGAAGWAADGIWFVSKSAAALPCSGLTGQFQFTVAVPQGRRSVVQWVFHAGQPGEQVFQLDRKNFYRSKADKVDISRYQKGSWRLRIAIEKARVVHYLWTGTSWRQLASVDGDFRHGNLVFSKDSRLTGFSFAEE